MSKTIAYAIDFGTSNTLIAAVGVDRVEVLPIAAGAPDPTILRSILYTPELGEWFFGDEAISEYSSRFVEGRLLRSIKKYLPDSQFTHTSIHNKNYSLIDLISFFLKEIRQRANAIVGSDVTKVVLGRPAAFSLDESHDQLAQNRLQAAAQMAGFQEIHFLPEPIAAAYEFRQKVLTPQTVLVADFGGGTSDFTVLKMSKQAFSSKDIMAINGISIAGDRFDGSIMSHSIAPHFGSKLTYKLPLGKNVLGLPHNILNKMCSAPDISFFVRGDIRTLLEHAKRWALSPAEQKNIDRLFVLAEENLGYRLFEAIEKTKITLSDNPTASFNFSYPGLDVEESITSESFVNGSADIVKQIMATLDACVEQAQITHRDVNLVCLTGGTAKVPAIRQALIDRFGVNTIQTQSQFHSIINGLALKAQELFAS